MLKIVPAQALNIAKRPINWRKKPIVVKKYQPRIIIKRPAK
jgi:hypothetical protein